MFGRGGGEEGGDEEGEGRGRLPSPDIDRRDVRVDEEGGVPLISTSTGAMFASMRREKSKTFVHPVFSNIFMKQTPTMGTLYFEMTAFIWSGVTFVFGMESPPMRTMTFGFTFTPV